VAEAADGRRRSRPGPVRASLTALADDDAGVLDGMVHVDVQIALGVDLQVDAGVTGEALQHVVEEAHPGADLRLAGFRPESRRTRICVSLVSRDHLSGAVGGHVRPLYSPALTARSFNETCGPGPIVGDDLGRRQ